MAFTASGDLVLTPLRGDARPLSEWLTTFHLATVALDPYTNQSSWILPTARRILSAFRDAAVRTNFLIACEADDAQAFLGPLADEFLVFCDPDRVAIKGFGLQRLPAFAFVRIDGTVEAKAEGWEAMEWRAVAKAIADTTQWATPAIPSAGDPTHFAGTPVTA
jgi:hypothetical protein